MSFTLVKPKTGKALYYPATTSSKTKAAFYKQFKSLPSAIKTEKNINEEPRPVPVSTAPAKRKNTSKPKPRKRQRAIKTHNDAFKQFGIAM